MLPPPSRRARQHIIGVTLRDLLTSQPHISTLNRVSAADRSASNDADSLAHRALDAVDELALWGAGRTGGYLPGDLVRWCRRAHLRASVCASRAASSMMVADASRAESSHSCGDRRVDATGTAGSIELDAVELQRCLSTALVEVVPASLAHPWEVTPSTHSSVSGAAGLWSTLAGYENVKIELRRMLAWPEQHSEAWYAVSTSGHLDCHILLRRLCTLLVHYGRDLHRTALALPRPKGVLLYGPSGCGKTVLARGLATAFPALNVLEVRGTALFSPLVGEAEAALRDVVQRVRLCNCVYLPLSAKCSLQGLESSALEPPVITCLQMHQHLRDCASMVM